MTTRSSSGTLKTDGIASTVSAALLEGERRFGIYPYRNATVIIPPPDGRQASPDYDEVYLTTRYASVAHWAATRDAAAMGGDGPDYAALQAALAVRQSLTIESKVTFLKGATGPLGPVYMPGTGEKFIQAP